MKVVLIDTRYVKADPTSFKSVVQSLTGKDSCVAWVENSSVNGTKKSTTSAICTQYENNKRQLRSDNIGHVVCNINTSPNYNSHVNVNINHGNDSPFMLTRGMSFHDLDRTLLELPTSEDLQYWLSDDL